MASANPLEGAQEIQQMLVAYAKQETIEPLKTLGSYLAWGLAGALCVFIGSFFMGLGVLRLFQSEFGDTFAGGSFMSTIPYLIALGALVAIMITLGVLLKNSLKKVQS